MNNTILRFAEPFVTGRTLIVTLAIVIVCCTSGTDAAVILELEEDGTAVNNSVATAAKIPPAAFTVDPNPHIFTAAEGGLPGTAVTASIIGHTGGGESLDIDFYCFTLPVAGPVWLDIDGPRTPDDFLDSTLHLFDGSGTLIAQGDDSAFWIVDDLLTDPGSFGDMLDSFIGAITLSAGTYYAAVAQYPNYANGGGDPGSNSYIPMLSNFSPEGFPLWSEIVGATVGDESFFFGSGPQSASADYVLHISTTAIPEPTTLTYLVFASGIIGFLRFRATNNSSPIATRHPPLGSGIGKKWLSLIRSATFAPISRA